MRIPLAALSAVLLFGAAAPAFAQYGPPGYERRDERYERERYGRDRFERDRGGRERELARQQEIERQRAMERGRGAPPVMTGRGGPAVNSGGCPGNMVRRGPDCVLYHR